MDGGGGGMGQGTSTNYWSTGNDGVRVTVVNAQSGAGYSCIQPAYSMPAIVTSKSRPADIEVIKRYFCSEYACMMVAEATGASYDKIRHTGGIIIYVSPPC